ncbi:F-box protein [Striga asiatica]|uniref:F-box protein n=1 Tax=Striga asiatica TaxID=4170 RepID=A0A5A7R943_STRAF|nr:F-box protein [Striga asiatica]
MTTNELQPTFILDESLYTLCFQADVSILFQVETSVMKKPFPSDIIRIGCDGLLLKSSVLDGEGTNTITLSIQNPLTRQNLVIPPLHGIKINEFTRYGVAYAPVSKVYKVALALPPESEDSTTEAKCCYIFTVGDIHGSWRNVSTAHLSIADKKAFEGQPLTYEGGFIHWIALDNDRVLTMDIETETIKETPLPINEVDAQPTVFLSTGEYLSFLVLVFGDANEPSIFVYHLDTKEMVTLELPEQVHYLCPIIHKNSLIRF